MTRYQVELSRTARVDILGIVRYIQVELQEPRLAGKLYGQLKEQISSLSYLPERNAIVDIPKIRELGLRRLLVRNYSVFYHVDNEQNIVRIVRVMYSGRDITAQLTDTQWNEE